MNPCAIVTLTGYADIFEQFRASVELHEPARRKIVVTSRGVQIDAPGWEIVSGIEPFVFARHANLGIARACPDDVLLVNDDVTLEGPVIEQLRRAAYLWPDIGVLSPQFRGYVTGNRLQNTPPVLSAITESHERLCFTCVYLRRAVLDRIGPLDERFVGYGRDDDDYCLRVQRAGLKLAVAPGVFVQHGFGGARYSASFQRAGTRPPTGIDPEMTRLWIEKYPEL